jgi:hypothetical protein
MPAIFVIMAFLFALFRNTTSLDDTNDPSVKWLEKLEGSLVWEERSLLFVAVGVPILLVCDPAGLAIGGLGAVVLLIMVRSICSWGHKVPPGFCLVPCVVTSEVVLQFVSLDSS